ncbi:MAG: hypothetical protein RRY12_01235 [Cloacibacillus sp.]
MFDIKNWLASLATGMVSSLKVWVVQQILEAEQTIPGATGTDKRAYVVQRLDDMVKLPWYIEPFDGPAFGVLVDLACDKLNLLCGHDWASVTLTPEQITKVAAVVDAPKTDAEQTVAAATAINESASIDDRIEALYKKYGIK